MFTPDYKFGPLMPSMYFMFAMQDCLPIRLILKVGVEQFVFRGADLMWPGVYKLDKGVKEIKQGQIGVIYAQQASGLVAIATGRMAQNWQAAEGEDREVPKKGKAVAVDHYLFDELWNMGSRKLPEEIMIKVEDEAEPEREQDISSKGHKME